MIKQLVSIFTLGLLINTTNLIAQSDVDALRLGMQYSNGSARNMGLGNTMGSIGGVLSSIHTNPAALGRITSSEVSLAPVVSIFNCNSNYIGKITEDSKLKFGVYNFSAAMVSKYVSNYGKWSTPKVGFSFNNLANLNQNFYISGFNQHNSLVDKYFELLDEHASTTNDLENMFPFNASLAYNTDLVYFDTTDHRIYSAINNGNVQQDIVIQRKGNLNEMAIAVASTYSGEKRKIHIGATIGVPTLNFTESTIHKETDTPDSSYNFNFFKQNSSFRVSGLGVNLKLGLLAELSKNVRLSFAFQTPSVLFLNDAFNSKINADYVTYTAEAESPEGLMKYNLRLPWKLNTGMSYISKIGLIAAEYELSDAGASKYNYKNADADIKEEQRALNQTIKNKYKLYHTLKLGLEAKIDPIRLRGGVQIQSSPFDKNFVADQSGQLNFIYSAGVGYRKNKFAIDLAYQFTKGKESYTPYVLQNEAPQFQYTSENNFKRSVIALTLGYKF